MTPSPAFDRAGSSPGEPVSRQLPGSRPHRRRVLRRLPADLLWQQCEEGQFTPPSGSLFPFPRLAPEEADGHPLSRSGRHLFRRRCLARDDANLAIDALNSLYGCSELEARADCSATMSASLSAAARSVQGRILTAVARFRPPSVPSPQAAAAELLGCRLDYLGEGATTGLYDSTRVSLPTLQSAPVPLRGVVSGSEGRP